MTVLDKESLLSDINYTFSYEIHFWIKTKLWGWQQEQS